MPAPASGHGSVAIGGKDHDLDHDGRHARTGQQRGNRPHPKGEHGGATALLVETDAARQARKVDVDDIEHCQGEHDEEDGNAEVEPG
jgi:hypothetical protein